MFGSETTETTYTCTSIKFLLEQWNVHVWYFFLTELPSPRTSRHTERQLHFHFFFFLFIFHGTFDLPEHLENICKFYFRNIRFPELLAMQNICGSVLKRVSPRTSGYIITSDLFTMAEHPHNHLFFLLIVNKLIKRYHHFSRSWFVYNISYSFKYWFQIRFKFNFHFRIIHISNSWFFITLLKHLHITAK